MDRELFRRVFAEQRFFRLPADADEHAPLPGFQLAVADELRFEGVRQRQIEIVAAENQVLADSDAMELHFAVIAGPHADEREVGRAAADVADEDFLARLDQPFPIVAMPIDPRIERGLRLFDQHDARQTGEGRGLHRQFAGHFVERRRQRDDHILLGQRRLGKLVVPRVANVLQIARAGFHRRDLFDLGQTMPREQLGCAIDARMAKPRLGRFDQPTLRQDPVVARNSPRSSAPGCSACSRVLECHGSAHSLPRIPPPRADNETTAACRAARPDRRR